MGALVGLGVGVGLLLVWSAFFVPVRPRVPGRHGRTGTKNADHTSSSPTPTPSPTSAPISAPADR